MDNGAESHHSPSRGSVHHPDGNDDSAESLRLADDTTGKRSRLPPSHPLSQNQLGPPEKRIRAATVGTTPPPNTASTSTTSSAAQQQLTREEPNLGENDTPPHSPDSFVEREEEEDGCRVPATTATTATTTPASGEVADRVHGIGILKGDSNLVGHSTPKSPIGIIQRPTTSHSESVCSDLSSVSGATTTDDGKYPVSYVVNHNERRHESSSSDIAFSADKDNLVSRGGQRSLSPNPRFRVPPAPPSTPASLRSSLSLSFSFDGLSDFVGPPSLASSMSTPIAPMLAGGCYVRSSDILEQQQQQQRRLQQDMFDGGATPMTQSAERTAAVANTGSGSSSGATFIMEPATPKPAATEAATPKPSGPTPTSAKPSTMATAPLPDDFSDWTVGERYKLVRILGRGSYGEVAQAIDVTKTAQGHGEPVYVAIKRIQSPFDQQLDAVRLYREIHILRRMKEGGEDVVPPTNQSQKSHHDCIILLLDVVQPKALEDFNDLYLVFECKSPSTFLDEACCNTIQVLPLSTFDGLCLSYRC